MNTPCIPEAPKSTTDKKSRNRSRITEQNNDEPQQCADNRTENVGAARRAVSPLRTDTQRSLRGTEENTYRRGAARRVATHSAAAGPSNQQFRSKNGGRRA